MRAVKLSTSKGKDEKKDQREGTAAKLITTGRLDDSDRGAEGRQMTGVCLVNGYGKHQPRMKERQHITDQIYLDLRFP